MEKTSGMNKIPEKLIKNKIWDSLHAKFQSKRNLFTAGSLATVAAVWITTFGMSEVPQHILDKWARETAKGREKEGPNYTVGVNPELMTRLAKIDRDTLRNMHENSPEFNIVYGIRRTGPPITTLPDAWLTWNPNRPKSASVEAEALAARSKTWRQRKLTCASHAAEGIVRHKLIIKEGKQLPDWNADNLSGEPDAVYNALHKIPKRRSVTFKVRDLSIDSTTYTDIEPSIWNPLLQEAIKQEIAAGRPVAFGAPTPDRENYYKGDDGKWRMKEQIKGKLGPHAMIMVGYEETEDGKTTWTALDSNRGVVVLRAAYIDYCLSMDVYSIE